MCVGTAMTGENGASHAYSTRLPLLALPWMDDHHHARPARRRLALLPDNKCDSWLLEIPLDCGSVGMEKTVRFWQRFRPVRTAVLQISSQASSVALSFERRWD